MAPQIIGVGAAVIGDMSSRPYWGLYELDFVFSTLVVRPSVFPLPSTGLPYWLGHALLGALLLKSTGKHLLRRPAYGQVGSILNFSLMYFLAPTAGASAVGANLLQKLFSEQTLRAWGAPGLLPAFLCVKVLVSADQQHMPSTAMTRSVSAV